MADFYKGLSKKGCKRKISNYYVMPDPDPASPTHNNAWRSRIKSGMTPLLNSLSTNDHSKENAVGMVHYRNLRLVFQHFEDSFKLFTAHH